MIKLLIVDDEQVERDGMQAILHNAYPDLVIEQAKNGKIAVEMARKFEPDVVLMDIKMPGMNGLEAIEEISKDYPQIKFIMVTAYDTFDYVRQAMKLGAKDYLLKPSKTSEIKATVGKVLNQVIEEKESHATSELQKDTLQKTLALVETDVVTQLLFDHVHEVHLNILVEMLDIQSTEEMFVMTVLIPSGSENLYTAVKEKVRQKGSGWVGALYGGQLPIIVFREPNISFRSQAIFLARQILSLGKYDQGSGWFVGIGSVCHSLNDIKQSYQDSLIATMDTTVSSKYRIYSDVSVNGSEGRGKRIQYREKDFSDQIRLGHWDLVRMSVMDLIQNYESEGANLIQTQQRVLEMLWVVSRVLNEVGVETTMPFYTSQNQQYRQLRAETGHLLDRMKQRYIEHYDQIGADTIQQIKQYIIKHSHEDISLDTLAKKVGLSPIYISKMFKEKLGINYIDFLTECRIEKAKKLMSDPEKSIKEITFEVGYREPNYFSKVFKKMCSVSPKKYRQTLLEKKTNS